MMKINIATRLFSSATIINSRFKEAYNKHRQHFDSKQTKQEVKNPFNEKPYWESNKERLKPYVHPYHTQRFPMVLNYKQYLTALYEAVGPEQVSPHYESLTRSRRLIVLYFAWLSATVMSQQTGGWEFNDQIRAAIFTCEFWAALLVGYIEFRNFAYFFGPKFSVFYDTFAQYEMAQLGAQWQDCVEDIQNIHLSKVKEQLQYQRINKEYESVKRRSIGNYLVNQRKSLQNNFHDRTSSLLEGIQRMERENLNTELGKSVMSAYDEVKDQLLKEDINGDLQRKCFQSALDGIRKGEMDYEIDPILPRFTTLFQERTQKLKNLSELEESEMLSLKPSQKRILSQSDKKLKYDFLSKAPGIGNASLKSHDKFKLYSEKVAKARN